MPAGTPSQPLVPSTERDRMTDHPFDPSQHEVSAGDNAGYTAGPRHARHAEADGPLDLSALRADDELLTALCSYQYGADPDQDPELKTLLHSWRLDVDATPIPELVGTDAAMRAIETGVRTERRRPRYLVPLASAAAVLVIVFAGMSLAARDAHPGDALWGLSEVLYADHARSVEAAALVRDDLTHATLALARGHLSEARNALDAAQASLPSVDESDGKSSLQTQQQSLLNQLNATTSESTAPLPATTQSSVPVLAPDPTTTQSPAPTTQTTTQAPPPTTTTQPPPTTTTQPPPPTSSDSPQSGTLSPQQQGGTPTDTNQGNTAADTATS